MSFGQAKNYFSEFLQPRKCNGVGDFIEFGLLPDIKGIYRQDYLAHMGKELQEEPFVTDVLLTHAHADHASYIHHLRKDINIWVSPATGSILHALDDTARTGFTDLVNFTECFQLRPKKRGEGLMRQPSAECLSPRPIKVFEYGKKYRIGDVEVVPYEVDHSLPGATGYIIHTTAGTIVYTGDMRFHGYKPDSTSKFVQAAVDSQPDILVTEGTRVDEKTTDTEQMVMQKSGQVVNGTKQLVVVNFPIRDVYRLSTFLKIAQETNRQLCLSFKQAYLLEMMEQDGVEAPLVKNPNISLYAPRKEWGLIGRKNIPEEIIAKDYEGWEMKYLNYGNTVNYLDIQKNPSKYMLFTTNFDLKNMIDVRPPAGSSYIRSVCEPFDEEMEIEFIKFKNWLDHFGLPMHQIHCSGHAPGPAIFGMVKEINAKKVMPIHTVKPELFKGENVVRVEIRKGYTINIDQ